MRGHGEGLSGGEAPTASRRLFAERPRHRLIEALSHFDEVVRMSLGMDGAAAGSAWRERAQVRMGQIGYDRQLSRKFVELIARYEEFFRRNDYLFRL